MYYGYYFYPYQYQNYYGRQPVQWGTYPGIDEDKLYNEYQRQMQLKDAGPAPYVVNINEATVQNNTFRTALWTGQHLQVTLMSLNVGEDIGLEIHPDVDQFLRVEQGQGIVQMGKDRNNLNITKEVSDDTAIIVPAGTWHNVINTGNVPLKLYSIYAPPQHPHGTVHHTKAEAMQSEYYYW